MLRMFPCATSPILNMSASINDMPAILTTAMPQKSFQMVWDEVIHIAQIVCTSPDFETSVPCGTRCTLDEEAKRMETELWQL